jgi:hypothetical protein
MDLTPCNYYSFTIFYYSKFVYRLTLSYVNATVGLSAGIIGSITLGINSLATPAVVSSNGGGPGNMMMPGSTATNATTVAGSTAVPVNPSLYSFIFVTLILLLFSN